MSRITTPTDSKITCPALSAMKKEGRRISVLTAYDYPTARVLDEAGVDVILVGDSLANVVQGRETTLGVTLDQMIYHAEMVARAASRALVVTDMPFLSYQCGIDAAVENAGRILKETLSQAVKIEGGVERADAAAAMVAAGIPVMGHIGLRPQSVHVMGGYKVQRDRERLLEDATALQKAGAFAIVLECIPAKIAEEITAQMQIPTIGIGSGVDCDGQVLVVNDMLGFGEGRLPSFVKQFADLRTVMTKAVSDYCNAVRTGKYPGADHVFQ